MTTQQPAVTAVSPRDLAAALRGAGLTDVDDSARRRAEYSTDASNYRVVPSVVAFPRDVAEAATALHVATQLGVPVTSRGGGTSTAGNSIGSGLVLDFSRHMNRVLSVDPDARTAVVEPGAILDDITVAAAGYGLRFGPDPSTHARASIGGSIGNNACGARALRYGRTADNVVSLDLLTASGARLTARRFGRDGLAAAGTIGAALDTLVAGRLGLIRTEFGRFTRQVSGYSLEHLLPENGADLAKFLAGTEGTLGLVAGATVALVPSPKEVALAVVGYPGMPEAADAAPGLLPHGPVAVEGMNAQLVDVFRARRGAAAVPGLPRGEAWLFVETAGDTEAEARAAAGRLIADAGGLDALVVTGTPARALWRIREDGAGLGGRTPAGAPAWPGWEDAAVPPRHLGAYLRDFGALMADQGLDGLVYGHFGDGCVHVRIDFPFATEPGRYREFALAAAQLVGKYGGSMSGEHGDGRARGELLPYMYSPEAIDTLAAVKAIFDPGNVFNPGVLVDPVPIDADLRVPQARPIRAGLGFAYAHDDGDLSVAVHRCTGVGKCRADTTAVKGAGEAGGGVMCPSYLATRDEKDSTRGRSRVLQELANGTLVKGFGSAELAEALDLCLSCKGCSSDCPAGVDMATYKAEVLYQRYRRQLRPAAHYSLGWLPRWARLASRVPGLANAALRPGTLAGVAKRLGGIDARRPLPQFATQGFRQWFAGASGSFRRSGAAVGGHVHRPLHARRRPGRGASARGGRLRGGNHRQARVLRADVDLHRPARRRAQAAAADAGGPGGGGAARHPDRRTGTLVHGRAARRPRRAAARRPTGPRGTRRHPHARRAAGRDPELGTTRPFRRARGSPAALPSPCRHGLAHRRRAARPGWRRGQGGRRLLRAGRKFRGRTRPLRCLAGRGRDRPAARRARRGTGHGGAGRRVLLPHPARPARPRREHAPGRAPGQPPGGRLRIPVIQAEI